MSTRAIVNAWSGARSNGNYGNNGHYKYNDCCRAKFRYYCTVYNFYHDFVSILYATCCALMVSRLYLPAFLVHVPSAFGDI